MGKGPMAFFLTNPEPQRSQRTQRKNTNQSLKVKKLIGHGLKGMDLLIKKAP
jgi:hypothetical protein